MRREGQTARLTLQRVEQISICFNFQFAYIKASHVIPILEVVHKGIKINCNAEHFFVFRKLVTCVLRNVNFSHEKWKQPQSLFWKPRLTFRSESLSFSWQSWFNCQICDKNCVPGLIKLNGKPSLSIKYNKLFPKSHLVNFAVDKNHKWGEDRLTNYCIGKGRWWHSVLLTSTTYSATYIATYTVSATFLSFILACYRGSYLHDFWQL